MPILILVFGLFTNTLLASLVGLLGSRRTIGFTWSFLLSLIFSPLVGLIALLFFEKLPYSNSRNWGCLGSAMAAFGLFMFFILMLVILFIILV